MAGNLTTTASKLSDKPQTNFRCSLSIEWIGESNELNDIVDLKTRLELWADELPNVPWAYHTTLQNQLEKYLSSCPSKWNGCPYENPK